MRGRNVKVALTERKTCLTDMSGTSSRACLSPSRNKNRCRCDCHGEYVTSNESMLLSPHEIHGKYNIDWSINSPEVNSFAQDHYAC